MESDQGYTIRISVEDMGGPKGPPVMSVDSEIFRQSSLLDLEDGLMYEVQHFYETVRSNGLTKYKQEERVITALIYVICRRDGIPLTLHKICDVLKTDYRSINKVYRYLVKKTGLYIPPTTPTEYLERFARELKMSEETVLKAKNILQKVRKTGAISGKGPAGVAAASLCLASDIQKLSASQKEIAQISGVTQVTIRNRYRELEACINGNH
jgi:transcription initiation factor TFIIB